MKFECQESCGGKCCTARWDNKSDFIFLTKSDIAKLSNFLGKPVTEFAARGEFTATRFASDRVTYQWFLKNPEDNCRFLKNGKCSVYEARPTQCKTFPFWPELMVNSSYAALKDFCPGVGIGETNTHHLLAEQIKADKELCSNLIK